MDQVLKDLKVEIQAEIARQKSFPITIAREDTIAKLERILQRIADAEIRVVTS